MMSEYLDDVLTHLVRACEDPICETSRSTEAWKQPNEGLQMSESQQHSRRRQTHMSCMSHLLFLAHTCARSVPGIATHSVAP